MGQASKPLAVLGKGLIWMDSGNRIRSWPWWLVVACLAYSFVGGGGSFVFADPLFQAADLGEVDRVLGEQGYCLQSASTVGTLGLSGLVARIEADSGGEMERDPGDANASRLALLAVPLPLASTMGFLLLFVLGLAWWVWHRQPEASPMRRSG